VKVADYCSPKKIQGTDKMKERETGGCKKTQSRRGVGWGETTCHKQVTREKILSE